MKTKYKQKIPRYYDQLSAVLPYFAADSASVPITNGLIPLYSLKRGKLQSVRNQQIEENIPENEEKIDFEITPRRVATALFKKRGPIIQVPAILLPSGDTGAFQITAINLSTIVSTERSDISDNQEGNPRLQNQFSSTSVTMSDFSGRSTDSNAYSAIPSPSSQKQLFIEKSDFPYIPPLATNLATLLQTLPESPPASLSPITFTEEVVKLPDSDFVQYLEEDTLFLKSVIYGQRFTGESIFSFFSSLSDVQFANSCNIVSHQYMLLSKIIRFSFNVLTSKSLPECANLIEKQAESFFQTRTAMLWIVVPKANILVNHSRLMKYPMGIGLIGTAASEMRQVVAPNPLKSPLFNEEYDLPFCEDAEIILVEPILNKDSTQCLAVLLFIDKVHRSGATYLYWPQSDLLQLRFLSNYLYKVFYRFDKEAQALSIGLKNMGRFSHKKSNMIGLLKCMYEVFSNQILSEIVSFFILIDDVFYMFNFGGVSTKPKVCHNQRIGVASHAFECKDVFCFAKAADSSSFSQNIDGEYSHLPIIGSRLENNSNLFAIVLCRGKKSVPCFSYLDVIRFRNLVLCLSPIIESSIMIRKKEHELHTAIRAQDRLACLLQTAESLSRETDVDSLIEQIVTNSRNLVEADRASLFVINETKTHLISRVAHGTSKPILLPINSGIVGSVANSGEVINIPDVYQDQRFNSKVDKETGYRTKSLLSIPVLDQNNNIIAVTQLMNKQDNGPFTDLDCELAKAMGVFTGIALSNSLNIFRVSETTKEINSFFATIKKFYSEEHTSSLLNYVLNNARNLIHADICSLFLVGQDETSTTMAQSHQSTIKIGKGHGIVSFISEHPQIVNIPDAYKDNRFNQSVDRQTGYHTQSILGVPVKDLNGSLLAVIEMVNKDPALNGGIFSLNDEKIVEAFSFFIGICLDKTEKTHDRDIYVDFVQMMTGGDVFSSKPLPTVIINEVANNPLRSFDADSISDTMLIRYAATYFSDLGIQEFFSITNSTLIRFLLSVREETNKSTVFSWKKASSCVQFTVQALKISGFLPYFTKIELLALVVASLCHDLNFYDSDLHSNTQNDDAYSILFQNKSGKEIYHCEQTIKIITKEEKTIIDNLTLEQETDFMYLLTQYIQSTDMSLHFSIIHSSNLLVTPKYIFNPSILNHRLVFGKLLIKASDINLTIRRFPVFEKWAKNSLQRTPNVFEEITYCSNIIGFCEFISIPICHQIAQISSQCEDLEKNIISNLNEWKSKYK